jgi:hypothetical protein
VSRRWVCCDIGEVLVDETRVWSTWADVLCVPQFTLHAVLGACIATGGDHEAAFARLGVGDWASRYDEVQAALGGIQAVDLYPDVLPSLAALSAAGYGVAVIGNQPSRREAELRAAGVTADVMVMSDTLGVQKPSPAFFEAVMDRLNAAATWSVGSAARGHGRPGSVAGVVAHRGRRADRRGVALTPGGCCPLPAFLVVADRQFVAGANQWQTQHQGVGDHPRDPVVIRRGHVLQPFGLVGRRGGVEHGLDPEALHEALQFPWRRPALAQVDEVHIDPALGEPALSLAGRLGLGVSE